MTDTVRHDASSSKGHPQSSADWLDLHFEANRREYRAALDLVGIQPGWHVLDAACGAGSFLPWIAELVGSAGHISTIDLAPENVEIVKQRLHREWHFETTVDVFEGSVMDLPFSDETFDAIWFANTSQYLPDGELATALSEFHRVLKPGGTLALKDVDLGLWAVYPGPPTAYFALIEIALKSDKWTQGKGTMSRIWNMHRWFKDAGFVEVRQHLMPIEWRAPLTDAQRSTFLRGSVRLAALVRQAVASGEFEIQEDVRRFWEIVGDPNHSDHPTKSEDFYRRDGQMVVIGKVPPILCEG